jgi:hypothetical protein
VRPKLDSGPTVGGDSSYQFGGGLTATWKPRIAAQHWKIQRSGRVRASLEHVGGDRQRFPCGS